MKINKDLIISDSDKSLNDLLIKTYSKRTFSTNEEVIGTWVNGKTLYGRVFTNTFGEQWGYSATIATGIEEAWLVFGYGRGSGGARDSSLCSIKVSNAHQLTISLGTSSNATIGYSAYILYTKA